MERYPIEYDIIDYKKNNYALFPLQVSADSQVIINSNFDLIESFNIAVKSAKKDGLKLFIKPHPAEKNLKIIKYIQSTKAQNPDIFLTNENTYLLIKNSAKVLTINSTVGIEGLMYYKHIEVFGKAFYKPYCEPDLSKRVDKDKVDRFLFNYFFNILRDGDFFSCEPPNLDIINT